MTRAQRARTQQAACAELLGTLDHELRTPLTTIKGYTELLLDDAAGELNPPQREMLTRVAENAERLGSTITEQLPALCGARRHDGRSRRSD